LKFSFSIMTNTHYLSFLRHFMSAIKKLNSKFTHELETKCMLALVEAVNNVIFHGDRANTLS